jgi:hypothetical protein
VKIHIFRSSNPWINQKTEIVCFVHFCEQNQATLATLPDDPDDILFRCSLFGLVAKYLVYRVQNKRAAHGQVGCALLRNTWCTGDKTSGLRMDKWAARYLEIPGVPGTKQAGCA